MMSLMTSTTAVVVKWWGQTTDADEVNLRESGRGIGNSECRRVLRISPAMDIPVGNGDASLENGKYLEVILSC